MDYMCDAHDMYMSCCAAILFGTPTVMLNVFRQSHNTLNLTSPSLTVTLMYVCVLVY